MSFWPDIPERQDFKVRAESLTRIMCERYRVYGDNNGGPSGSNHCAISDTMIHFERIGGTEPVLKKRKFSLKDHIAEEDTSGSISDEVT